ncbi:mechanosensitive ion channel family protein [Siccationidurans ginsengisoli]|uniref:mechanosensitive ion channel family protein n=1 Tax=Hymenobacter TaxID=89966 RepID=UPI001AAD7DBC|nr:MULTISPECIES: mechanosensitive ion channel family protein [unclassified Hymenobacter]MBO2030033.1 mechanosensitive ion channel family protein [Hymenobacter sp. BT559]
MEIPDFLRREVLGNALLDYLIAAFIMLLGAALNRLVSRLLSKGLFRLTKRYTAGVSESELHDLLIQPLGALLFLASFYLAFSVLRYPMPLTPVKGVEPWPKVALLGLFHLGVIATVVWVIMRLVDFALLVVQRRAELVTTPTARRLDSQFLPFAKDLLKVFIVVIGLLVVLGQVFGVNVTALIGGLGIGGLAVAFAAKESLENLLASFTIFIDQPFGVGDLVTAGSVSGTVEKIGFRSTRLRTAEKSYLTVPNKSMIDKPLDNLSLRTARRVGFTLYFDQKTTSDQLQAIIKEAVAAMKEHPLVTDDVQMKFNAISPAGKEVTVQYFVETSSYDEYLDVKESLNYRLIEAVEHQGGSFALATPAPVAATA